MNGAELKPVRQLGSGQVHVARVDPSDIVRAEFMGAPARRVMLDPVVATCGAKLRASRGPVVVMFRGEIGCRACCAVSGAVRVEEL